MSGFTSMGLCRSAFATTTFEFAQPCISLMFKLIKFVFFIVTIAVAGAVTLALLALSKTPAIVSAQPAGPEEYAEVVSLAKNQLKQIQSGAGLVIFKASAAQLQSAERVLSDQIPSGAAKFQLVDGSSTITSSIQVNEQYWLNFSTTITESKEITFTHNRLGKLPLPGFVVRLIINKLMRHQLGYDLDFLNQHIDRIELSPQQAIVGLDREALNIISMGEFFDAYTRLQGRDAEFDLAPVLSYRNAFYALSKRPQLSSSDHSLAIYLAHIDITAKDKNLSGTHPAYALIALASLSNTPIINNLLQLDGKQSRQTVPFTLANRKDLAKHFLVSAAIQFLSSQNTSFSVGQAKEIIDSQAGGSGFSFVDLAADRAGILFVNELTQRFEQTPSKINVVINTESDIFPYVAHLKEGLSEVEFESAYQSTDSEAYLSVISGIDREILKQDFYN